MSQCLLRTEITPTMLLTTYPGKFYRLTNETETHRGLTYQTGLNIDYHPFDPSGGCQAGGMYFFHEESIDLSNTANAHSCSLKWLREVTFPPDARIYVEHGKFKADKFILGEREAIPEWVYMKSVTNNGMSLGCVPTKMRTREMCLEAVNQDEVALYYIPDEMKTEEMCLIAVKRTGSMLQYVPEELRTHEVCLEAVKNSGRALQYVPLDMKTQEVQDEARKEITNRILT